MKKVICFGRVSSNHQDLTPQLEAIKRQIKADGYKESEVIEVKGKESAIKLKEEQRQTLNEMKQMVAENPTIESIYFFAVDRLARRMSVVMSIKEWADEHKINLVFLNPNYMSTYRRNEKGELVRNELTDLLLAMLSYGAMMEMKIKQERFNESKALRRKQNKVNGKLPYGYTSNENGYIVKDSVESGRVLWVFDCYLDKGMSTAQIYNEGVELGYWKRLTSRTAEASRICQMLKNKVYCGKPNEKSKYGMVFDAIVDEEKIDAAIQLMKKKRHTAKTYQENIYFAKSILRDEESNTVMIGDVNHVKYRAANAQNQYGLNMNVADTLIWRSAMGAKWQLLSRKDDNTKQQTKDSLHDVSLKIVNLKKQIDDIQPKLDRNYKSYVNGRISSEMYEQTDDILKKEIEGINKKIKELEKREIELGNILNELETKEEKDVDILSFKEIKDDRQRKEIIDEVITSMTCKPIKKNWYLIKVYTKVSEIADEYLYIAHSGTKKELYWVNIKDIENYEGTIKDAIDNCELLDIIDEYEERFKRNR